MRLAAIETNKLSESQSIEELKEHTQKSIKFAASAFLLISAVPIGVALFLPSREEEALADFMASSNNNPEPVGRGQ